MEIVLEFCVSVLLQPLLHVMSDLGPGGEGIDSWARGGVCPRETGARVFWMLSRQRVKVDSLSPRSEVLQVG